jgi:PAS domain S-box-containing protein
VGGQFWGRVMFGSARERQWTADERAFATEIAARVGNAVLAQERQRVEDELRASRERYRNFIEMSAELMWRVEFDEPIDTRLSENIQVAAVLETGYIADANDALAVFFGLEKGSQLVGRRLSAVWAPLDRARRAEVLSLVRSGYRVVNYEASHTVNGVQRWVLRNALGIFEDGKLVRLWGASRDITSRRETEEQLRQSEERYRAFVANSSEGIFRIEYPEPIPVDLPAEEIVRRSWSQARMAECNMALAKLRGVSHPDELNGRLSNQFRMATPEAVEQELEFVRSGFHLAGMERPTMVGPNAIRWFRYSMTGAVEDGLLTRVWGTVSDVTDRKHLEQELRALSARQADILEQERTRIAREIHDELGQQLTALKFEAAALEAGKRPIVKGDMTQQVDAAIHALRRIANELRPAILDHFGLGAAVEWQSKEFTRRTAIHCDCKVAPELNVRPELATTVFRIMQEALTNAARHSGAKRIAVALERIDGVLQLTVHDDGRGMATPASAPEMGIAGPPSLGLIGMRERALGAGGTLEIHTGTNTGTRVLARFPLSEGAAQNGLARAASV